MQSLTESLNSQAKQQFFDRLSLEAYSNLPADLLTMFEGEDHRPYIVFNPLVVKENFVKSLRQAGESFWSMATSTAQIFQHLSESEILDWGYPEDYIPQFLSSTTAPSEMRLDIAVNPEAFINDRFRLSDFKVLESNSATPGFWSETFVFNTLIAEHFGYRCPNKNMGEDHTADFIDYLKTSFPEYRHGIDTVYFSFPYVGPHEDILSFDARMGYFEKLGGKAEFIYSDNLILETDTAKEPSLKTPNGDVVKYLFLHYPNEWLIEDEGEIVSDDGLNVIPTARPWDYIQQLELEGKLFRVPPIQSEIIQNKGFFAFLWEGVHNNRFDPETQRIIEDVIPQTYCTYEEAISNGLTQVWEKPIYGREGAGIILWEDGQELVNTYNPEFDPDGEWYQNMLAVFQENCSMPALSYPDEEVYLMFTVYLSAEGKATGIGCRAVSKSHRVIDATKGLWIPLAVVS